MPARPGRGQEKSKKKKGFFSRYAGASRKFVADRGKEIEDIVTGLPQGAAMTAKAIDQALPANPVKPVEKLFFEKEGRHNDPKAIKEIGKLTFNQMKEDLRHPLRNPTSTTLTLLGLATLGGGTAVRATAGVSAVSKTGKVSQGVRAALGPQVHSRSFSGVARVPGQKSVKYKGVPANNNPAARLARKATLDVAYKASAKRAAESNVAPRLTKGSKVIDETSKEYLDHIIFDKTANAYNQKLKARHAQGKYKNRKLKPTRLTNPNDIRDAVLEAGYVGVRKKSGNIKVYDRSAVKARQKGAYARKIESRERNIRRRMHHERLGGDPEEFGSPKEVRQRMTTLQKEKRDRKLNQVEGAPGKIQSSADVARYLIGAPMNLVRASMYIDPKYTVQNMMGTAQLLAQQGVRLPTNIKTSRKLAKEYPEAWDTVKHMSGQTGAQAISYGAKGPGTKYVQKLGEIAGKPEQYSRPLAIIEEMYRTLGQGGRKVSVEDIAKFAQTANKEGIHALQGAQRRGLEEVIDYNRLGKNERSFMKTQIPIFYPMTKGFTRYAAQYPTKHSIQSALAAQLGQMGDAEQKRSFGGVDPPPWAPYAMRTGPTTIKNPQNSFTFSPGMDVARQAGQAFVPGEMIPGLNLAQQAGPLPNLAVSALLGRELASGYPHRGEEEGQSAFGDALREYLALTLPGMDYVKAAGYNPFNVPASKTFKPMDLSEQALFNIFGPTLVDRQTNMPKFLKQSKAARKISRGRKW
jgi:hypothetical protein